MTKITPAGMLRKRVRIEALSDAVTPSGGTSDVWTLTGNAWARVEPVSGRESLRGHVLHGETTHMITIRFRGAVTRKHRIALGSRSFDIVDVRDVDELGADMQIQATERDPT